MADRRTPKPTGRRVRGYISDLVELSAPRVLWTALVYQPDYRDDALLAASADKVAAFLQQPGIPGVPALTLTAPGVFAFDTQEIRSTRELMGAARAGIGWKAAAEWFRKAATILDSTLKATGLVNHGSLDPHRILIGYKGELQVIGFGLPRLDLVDFLDDPALLPPTEALRFTAPESLEGTEEDFSTDLFVLGLLAVRLATGAHLIDAAGAQELLAQAADGEVQGALGRLGLDPLVLAWLKPVLAPWPDERPASMQAALGLALPCEDLEGRTLAATMEAFADDASDVEVDLPAGWVLPVPPPPLDDVQKDQAVRRLKKTHQAAVDAVTGTTSTLEAMRSRPWELSKAAAEAFEEASRHHRAALDAVQAVADTVERCEAAASHASLDQALAEGEDARDRARGANAEAVRAIDRARETLGKAEAAAELAQARDRAERATTLAEEVESLGRAFDTIEQVGTVAVAPLRDRARDLHQALHAFSESPGGSEALQALEQAVSTLHTETSALDAEARRLEAEATAAIAAERERERLARVAALDARIHDLESLAVGWRARQEQAVALDVPTGTLDAVLADLAERLRTVRELRGDPDPDTTTAILDTHETSLRDGEAQLDAILNTLREKRRRLDAENARRQGVTATLEHLRKEAGLAVQEANAAGQGWKPVQTAATAVHKAMEALHEARQDASRAEEALQSLELEPGDDPDVVLDAANTHLEAARAAAERAKVAATHGRAADEEAVARMESEARDRLERLGRLRAALAETGHRVEHAQQQSADALEDAQGLASALMPRLRARQSHQATPLQKAIDALASHRTMLAGRRANWEAMAAPADGLEDPDELESLVHTGDAEASFAEADLADLPPLIDAFEGVLANATAEQQTHDDALKAAHDRVADLVGTADEAESILPPAVKIPPALNDADLTALLEALQDAASAARSHLASFRTTAVIAPGELPDADTLHRLDDLARRALAAAETAAEHHAELQHTLDERLEAAREREARRAQAVSATEQALEALQQARLDSTVKLPVVADEAVADRVKPALDALSALLDRVQDVPAADPDPETAAAQLAPLVVPAQSLATQIQAAHTAYLALIAQKTALVETLRTATERSEAAADRAARVSAAAKELLTGLMGPWPHLAQQQAEVKAALATLDQHASATSDAAEAAAGGEDAEQAAQSAELAEREADATDRAFAALQPLADSLSGKVKEARAAIAQADEQRRLQVIEKARGHATTTRALVEALDEASSAAVTALEDTPSEQARAAWLAAEPLLDGASDLLAGLEEALQSVFNASTADEAEALHATIEATLETAPGQIDLAIQHANQVTETAHKELAANEELVVELQGQRNGIDDLHKRVTEMLVRDRKKAAELPEGASETIAGSIGAIVEHQRHIEESRAVVADAIESAVSCSGERARKALRTTATDAVARANAAVNTATAVSGKLAGHFESALQAEQAARQSALEQLTALEAAMEAAVDMAHVEARLVLDSAPEDPALHQLQASLAECDEVLAGSAIRRQEATPEATSTILQHLAKQAGRAQERLTGRIQAVRDAIRAVEQARIERERAAQERDRAFLAEHVDKAARLQARHLELQRTVATCISWVTEAEGPLQNSPSVVARREWEEAHTASNTLSASVDEVADAIESWPPPPTVLDDASRTHLSTVAAAIEARVDSAIGQVAATRAQIERHLQAGMISVEALAGILVDASAVRERFDGYRQVLESKRALFLEAMADAPIARSSLLHTDAGVQLEEIEQTLAEARASLDELGEAASPEEAEALLEVAMASLDIAESVLEYALPAVEAAITDAEAEARSERERRARVQAALALLEPALALTVHPDSIEHRIQGCTQRAALLDEERVLEAVAALGEAIQLFTLSYGDFRYSLPEDLHDPEPLVALAITVASARSVLDGHTDLLLERLAATEAVLDAAEQAERDRLAQLAQAQADYESNHAALIAAQQAASDTLTWAEEEGAQFPAAAVMELEVLRQAVQAALSYRVQKPRGDELARWIEAVTALQSMVEAVKAIPIDAAVEALQDSVGEARAEAAVLLQELEALDHERLELDDVLHALQAEAQDTLLAAQRTASDYPLEAGLPLAALEAAHEAIAAPESPELTEDLQASTQALTAYRRMIAALSDYDLRGMLADVETAVAAAKAEEDENRRLLGVAHDAILAARSRLQVRKDEADAMVAGLEDGERWPEARAAWKALQHGLVELTKLEIPEGLPKPLGQAQKAARLAEEIADSPLDIASLVASYKAAIEAAVQRRAAAVASHQAAAEAVRMRIALAEDSLPDLAEVPDAEPIRAAHKALTAMVTALKALSIEPIDPDQPSEALETLALLADAQAGTAAQRDVEGLAQEVAQAVQAARDAEQAEEDERLRTVEGAKEAIQAGLKEMTEALEGRDDAIRALPEGVERAGARAALEKARSSLLDLRNVRQQLNELLSVSEAVAIVFDTETHLEAGRAHLAEVAKHLQAAADQAVEAAEDRAAIQASRDVLTATLDDAERMLADAPAPQGPDAPLLDAQLANLELELQAASAALELATGAAMPKRADRKAVLQQLAQIEASVRLVIERAGDHVVQVQHAYLAEEQRETAMRVQALADARARAEKYSKNAQIALDMISTALSEASELAPKNHASLDAIAQASARALAQVDIAREAARAAKKADDPVAHEVRAREAAESAQQEAFAADEAIHTLKQDLVQAQENAERAKQAAKDGLEAARAAKLPQFLEHTKLLEQRLARFEAPVPNEDPLTIAAVEAVIAAHKATREANEQAMEAVATLASAKSADVEHFIADAQRAIDATTAAAKQLKAAMVAYRTEAVAGQTRRSGLELEEARGRAWEACALVRSLSTDLTRARAALPELPEHPNRELTAALDRLAEVERRLWRAGQKADEARERAGSTDDLIDAKQAAAEAELAVGRRARWERDIDKALGDLTALINLGVSMIVPLPPTPTKAATPVPTEVSVGPGKDNPTERLLARLREGKNRGETGRERLKRLRKEGSEKESPKRSPDRPAKVEALDPVSIPMDKKAAPNDYPSLQDFEDYQKTTVEPPKMVSLDQLATIAEAPSPAKRLKNRPAIDDLDQTVVEAPPNDDPDMEDVKTQAFSREMLEALLGGNKEPPAWGEDESSTRWDTREQKDPSKKK